jgi:demethylmenaquinone methyltransferase / 2-methoxy-6-polyprenyl-1,4-benzoquinol methylase
MAPPYKRILIAKQGFNWWSVGAVERWKGVETAHRFFSGTGSSYNLIANVCTFGFDFWWKRKILREIPKNPKCILDQACGTGILTIKLARRFPLCRVIGVELREEYLDIARNRVNRLNLSQVEFHLGRAEEIVPQTGIDCVTSSYLAKYADLGTLAHQAKKMLRPGGVLIMHDFTYPSGGVFLRLWKFYFRILQSMGAWAFPEWGTAFHELPAFLAGTRWVDELVSCLKESGFTDIRLQRQFMSTAAMVRATNLSG